MICSACNEEFPERLFQHLSWSFSREILCPICNHAHRNASLGFDPDTPFPDEDSNLQLEEARRILDERKSPPLDMLNCG